MNKQRHCRLVVFSKVIWLSERTNLNSQLSPSFFLHLPPSTFLSPVLYSGPPKQKEKSITLFLSLFKMLIFWFLIYLHNLKISIKIYVSWLLSFLLSLIFCAWVPHSPNQVLDWIIPTKLNVSLVLQHPSHSILQII